MKKILWEPTKESFESTSMFKFKIRIEKNKMPILKTIYRYGNGAIRTRKFSGQNFGIFWESLATKAHESLKIQMTLFILAGSQILM